MASISDSLRLTPGHSLGVPAVSISRGKIPAADCLVSLAHDTHILAAGAGDHPAVHQLLVQCYQSPQAEDFQSRLDEPGYSCHDRLLLQRAHQLVGHVLVSKQIGWFQDQRCPVARFQDFAVLPEYQRGEFDAGLLGFAETIACDEGAILGLVQTNRQHWFEQQGWSTCRGQGHSRANTRSILAHLNAHLVRRSLGHPAVSIQSWRHYQLDSILNIYQQISANLWGTLHRSLETWQWLVGRKAHDQILIAVQGTAGKQQSELLTSEIDDPTTSANHDPCVVGYAIVRNSKILEMMALPGYESACPQLLHRACRDAMDRDHLCVELHTPATDPLHELLVTSGGNWIPRGLAAGSQWMLKLLSPQRWIDRIYPVLHQRARDAGISRPQEIDFVVDEQHYRLTLTRRSARFEEVFDSPAPIRCSWKVLQDMLLSNLALPEAITQGQIQIPDVSVQRTLCALFPPKLIWNSPFPQLHL